MIKYFEYFSQLKISRKEFYRLNLIFQANYKRVNKNDYD